MRLGRLGSIELECHPLVLLPVGYAILAGQPGTMLLNLLALFLHELCHTFAAHSMGYRIKRIALQPFGFIARLEKRVGNRWDELAIASAGPLFSLIAGMACSALCASAALHLPGRELLAQFGRMNMLLGIINLLPALPLDGGRIAESLFRIIFPVRHASRMLLLLGIVAAIGAILCGVFMPLLDDMRALLFIMGAFLLLAVWQESRRTKEARVDAVLRRLDALRDGETIPVRFVGLHETVQAHQALAHIDPRGITCILVLNSSMGEVARISEAQLLDGIARLGMDATLHAIAMLR